MSPLHTFIPEPVRHEVHNQVQIENPHGEKHLQWTRWQTVSLWVIVLLLLLIFLHGHGWAQGLDPHLAKHLADVGLNTGVQGTSATYPLYVYCVASTCAGGGGGGGGTSSNFGAAFPAAGTAIGAANGGNMVSLNADGSGNLDVNLNANSFGALAVTGTFWQATQPVSNAGTFAVQAAQSGTWNVANTGTFAVQASQSGTWNVANTGTFAVQAAQSGTWNIGTVTTLTGITNALPAGSNTIGAVTQASGPWTNNVTQFGGTNISTGTGASGSGIPRVTISNDSSLAANQSVNVNELGGSAVYVDPCLVNTPIALPVSEATSSTTTIITGTASKQTYICGIFLVAAAATNINLVEGTGTNCSSVSAGLIGGSTAATGANLAANGGFVVFGGGYWVAKTATLADNVCYIASAGNQVSGVIKYVQQ